MSNDMKMTQEKWNEILDLKDKVEKLSRSLSETRTHLRATQLKNKQLEEYIITLRKDRSLDDFFKGKL